jgi:hypothetical protein
MFSIAQGFLIHCVVMAALLCYIWIILHRRGLFHWLSFGFWSWAAFSLYFLITPLIQYFGDPYYLETRLGATEGLSRLLWVTFCVAVGIFVYFQAYLRATPSRSNFGLPQEEWPRGTRWVLVLALVGAFYSLIYFRGAFGLEALPLEIEGGKYEGSVMGYQAVMHYFANFPIVLLLMRRSTRWLGVALAGIVLVGRFEDSWDRFTAVSLVLAITMIGPQLRQRRWPHPLLVGALVVFTLLMQARGHMPLSDFIASGRMITTSKTEVKRGEGANMLATLYLKTYLHDHSGYTYGIPFFSKLLFGPLPRKYFPWKDRLMEKLSPRVDYTDIPGARMMYGAKSSVIGDLYGFGNIIAVIIGMFLLGILSRKLDGFLAPRRPQAIQAIGICWLSSLWMMLGSALSWIAITFYLNAIPFVGVVICAWLPKHPIDIPLPRKRVSAPKSPQTPRVRHATRRDV